MENGCSHWTWGEFCPCMNFSVKSKILRIIISGSMSSQEWIRNCWGEERRIQFLSRSWQCAWIWTASFSLWATLLPLANERAVLGENAVIKSGPWCRENWTDINCITYFSWNGVIWGHGEDNCISSECSRLLCNILSWMLVITRAHALLALVCMMPSMAALDFVFLFLSEIRAAPPSPPPCAN